MSEKGTLFKDHNGDWRVGRVVLAVAVVLTLIGIILASFATVPPGHRGVVVRLGSVQDRILGEGFYTIQPFTEHIEVMSVRTLKYETKAEAASKDLQDTATTVALNFHLQADKVNYIYQTIGKDYQDTYIAPASQEVVKAVTANYNAEELITQRPRVKQDIEDSLKARLEPRGIVMETVSITDFTFSDEFHNAVESKVTAKQLALKAENDLVRIKIEAQQAVEKAKGESEAIRILQDQLSRSPEYTKFLATQKWDGKMPLVVGEGSMPLISVPTNPSK